MSLDLVGLIALLAGMPAIVLFVGFYWVRSDWRRYPAGRSLMYFAISLALTYLWLTIRLSLYLAGLSQENTILWQLVRIVLFSAITASAYRLLFVLIVTQRAPDRDDWMPDQHDPGRSDDQDLPTVGPTG